MYLPNHTSRRLTLNDIDNVRPISVDLWHSVSAV